MTPNDRWILPDGIDEALPEKARWLESARRKLIDLYSSWGYDLVMPPLIEYLDSLLTGTGSDLDLQTFKITDQISGRMMGVRADMTPQVARIDANRLQSEVPSRLCYIGTVLNTRPKGLSGSRSPIQVGAELYGHAGYASDREILLLLLETLKTCGIESVHLDLGHAGIYRDISASAGLSDEQTEILFEMLQRKAVPEINVWLDQLELTEEAKTGLSELAMLNGDASVIKQAREILKFGGDNIVLHLDQMEKLGKMVEQHYPEAKLNYDLAELSGYHYETGVVYTAYVSGEGREVARGGRYDGIGKFFGKSRPAVGFSVDLKILQQLSHVDFASHTGLIWAPANDDADLATEITKLRDMGERVVTALDGQAGPQELGCTRRLVNQDGQWAVQEIE